MIDQGLVMLIQAGLGSPPLALGGFEGQLPQNLPTPAYTFTVVSDPANATLLGTRGFGNRRYQFDCFGATALDAETLADAVDLALDGFQGHLPDPDSTYVSSIIRSDREGSKYSDSARNWWTMLEYEVWYAS